MVAVGFKAKWSAAFLVVVLSIFNVFANNWWAVHSAHPQRDFLKYDFFQTLCEHYVLPWLFCHWFSSQPSSAAWSYSLTWDLVGFPWMRKRKHISHFILPATAAACISLQKYLIHLLGGFIPFALYVFMDSRELSYRPWLKIEVEIYRLLPATRRCLMIRLTLSLALH